MQPVSVDQAHASLGPQILHGNTDGRGRQQVVRIEPGQNGTGGPGEALVDGAGLAAVGLGDPVGQPRLVAADDLRAAVRGTAVDDHVFDLRIVLREDRLDRLLDEAALVERGRNDGDDR